MAEMKPGTYGYNKEYAKKYMAKLSEVKLRMSPKEKDAIAAAAQRAGVSVNQYVLSAVQRRMNRQMERNEILAQLNDMELAQSEFWVITGGAMVLHGLRPRTHDIDLGITTELADNLEAQGYPVKRNENGQRKIIFNEDVEMFENWLCDETQMIDGFRVITLKGLLEMKKQLGREKDLRDIALIEAALEK